VPPEIAVVFRTLATLQGTLARLAPGFDIIRESQGFADSEITTQLAPVDLKDAAIKEVLELGPSLRRLPRRFDRITAAIERGQLSTNVRLLADPRDQEVFYGYLHQALVCVLAATTGIMAAVLLASQGVRSSPKVCGCTRSSATTSCSSVLSWRSAYCPPRRAGGEARKTAPDGGALTAEHATGVSGMHHGPFGRNEFNRCGRQRGRGSGGIQGRVARGKLTPGAPADPCGRGRDRCCQRPPAQIPACAANALGSCLGCGRRIARSATGA